MSNNYWAKRMAKAQQTLTDRNIYNVDKQMRKYYQSLGKKVMDEFESTYTKLLTTIQDGKQPTPADLYKLDKYWHLQSQVRGELRKLGEKQIALLTKNFERNYFEVYHSLNIEGLSAYKTIDKGAINQLINQIWCADGQSWSQRIWKNTELLAETLNEELIHCVGAGKKPTDLKKLLQHRFNVSYNNADMLVRTEMAHIQTQAAQHRYKDYGLEEVEVLVDEDERTCPICAKMEGKRYPINAQMPVPFHPRCRCCMIPVVDI